MPVTRGSNHGRTGTDGCRGQYMWTDARRLAPTHFQLSIDNCRLGPVHLHQIGIRQLAIEKSSLVPEVPDAREDHSHAVAVGGFNDFLVPDRAAGLNNRGRTGLGDLFYTVGERKKRVGSRDGAFQG